LEKDLRQKNQETGKEKTSDKPTVKKSRDRQTASLPKQRGEKKKKENQRGNGR